MDVQRFAGAGKRRLEANDDDEDHGGSEINGWDCCSLPGLKRFNAAWQQENITTVDSSPEDVADDAFSYISELLHDQGLDIPDSSSYDESTPVSSQGDFNEFLQSLLTESEAENLFSVPENESVAVPQPDNLNVSAPERLYSGPTLTDVKSALSIYGREEQYLSTSGVSNSGAMFSFLSENSIPSQQWLPTSGPKICHDAFSRGSNRSFSSSINDLFYKRLYRNKSEAKYSLKIKCSGTAIDDGYKWRKYGQKSIKNSPYPRSYYRCTNPRCCAKKQVERSVEDPETITVTYEGLHLHYSYSQLHLSQQPTYAFRQQGNGIYEKGNKRRAPEDKGNNDAMQSADSSSMVGVHQPQQLQHQEDNYCESFTFGVGEGHCDGFNGHGNGHAAVDAVDDGVVEGTDSGRGNGLLQDIVRFGIRNPVSVSSSSPSSSSSSP